MAIETERLTIGPATEADRAQLVDLFCDELFMEFSAGVMTEAQANVRIDRMIWRIDEIPFAKQPIRITGTDEIIGYSGFDRADFEGVSWVEMGWRLTVGARGFGYATEAGRALLAIAAQTAPLTESDRIALAIIDPRNTPSAGVARKLGFVYWKTDEINGFVDDIYRLRMTDLPV